MPWREASPMDQRTQFIADHLRDALSITELCALYGVARKTGYKWIDRYLRHGPAGLEERPRPPRARPQARRPEAQAGVNPLVGGFAGDGVQRAQLRARQCVAKGGGDEWRIRVHGECAHAQISRFTKTADTGRQACGRARAPPEHSAKPAGPWRR